jgi:hypothetical protein
MTLTNLTSLNLSGTLSVDGAAKFGATSTLTGGTVAAALSSFQNVRSVGTVGADGAITSGGLLTGANIHSAGTIGSVGAMRAGGIFTTAGTMFVFGTQQITMSGTIPTGGPWYCGNICFNTYPQAGKPSGWQCTAPGNPGTWLAMGTVSVAV